MIHAAIRAVPGSLLYHTWEEAKALWDRLVRRIVCTSLILMPDHLHIVLFDDAARKNLTEALGAFAQWRNQARGEQGPVFVHGAVPTPIRGREHVERTRRYIHLNPCRKGLCSDPLAWPFSTHRDMLGLAFPSVCRLVPDPERFHAFVSSDPAVNPQGTRLPVAPPPGTKLAFSEVRAAVSALTRTPSSGFSKRGTPRNLLISASRALTSEAAQDIADALGVDPSTVRRHAPRVDSGVALAARVASDSRFALLSDGDLRTLPAWKNYRHFR